MGHTWVAGFAGLVVLWCACGGDATQSAGTGGSGATTSAGSGGDGGMGTGPSTGSGATGPTTTSSTGGGGSNFATDCDEACAKVDMCAGFPGACAQIGVDCNDPQADCPAQCVNDADCPALLSLIGSSPDPTLQACLEACDLGGGGAGGGGGGGSQVQCGICTFQSCGAQSQACQGVPACETYVQCAANCSDSVCEQACLTASNGNAEAAALSTCTCNSCANDCAICP